MKLIYRTSASGCFDVSVWIVVYLLGSWRSEFLLLVDLVESTRWTVARVACFRIFPAPAGISLHVVESCSAPAGSGWDSAAPVRPRSRVHMDLTNMRIAYVSRHRGGSQISPSYEKSSRQFS